jgi:hypothetical protein
MQAPHSGQAARNSSKANFHLLLSGCELVLVSETGRIHYLIVRYRNLWKHPDE